MKLVKLIGVNSEWFSKFNGIIQALTKYTTRKGAEVLNDWRPPDKKQLEWRIWTACHFLQQLECLHPAWGEWTQGIFPRTTIHLSHVAYSFDSMKYWELSKPLNLLLGPFFSIVFFEWDLVSTGISKILKWKYFSWDSTRGEVLLQFHREVCCFILFSFQMLEL